VQIYRCQTKGIRLWHDKGFTKDSSVTIHSYWRRNTDPDYQYPALKCSPESAGTLQKRQVVIGPGVPPAARVIFIDTPFLNKDTTYQDHGVPYRVMELQIPGSTVGGKATLTIEAGVTMMVDDTIFVGGPACNVETELGNIVARGTKDKPIRFTTSRLLKGDETLERGSWSCILFRAWDKTTRFDHCIFEYSGGKKATLYHSHDGVGDTGGTICLMNPPNPLPYDGPCMTNCTIRLGMGDAVRGITQNERFVKNDYKDPKYGNKFEDFENADQHQRPPHGKDAFPGL